MKKIKYLSIILFLAIIMTGCNGSKPIKTLTCDYDFSQPVSSANKTTMNITFKQDVKTYEIVEGTVKFNVAFNAALSTDEMNEVKKSLEEQFCSEGFFGENTNASCKVTTETKTAGVVIEVDSKKLVEQMDQVEISQYTLEELKDLIESEFKDSVKCTIK